MPKVRGENERIMVTSFWQIRSLVRRIIKYVLVRQLMENKKSVLTKG